MAETFLKDGEDLPQSVEGEDSPRFDMADLHKPRAFLVAAATRECE
jgi:hypothetical protein